MNLFVAGIHGVGKTFLASKLSADVGFLHTSASKLIKEELSLPEWGTEKRVSDVDRNQIALAAAVKRHNDSGTRLLLDGHFVLLDSEGKFVRLGAAVFHALNLDGVILLEADVPTIIDRVRRRDGKELDAAFIFDFLRAEREQAELICKELRITLHTLHSANPDGFVDAIKDLEQRVK